MDNRADELFAAAQQSDKMGDLNGMIRSLTELFTLIPDDAALYYARGIAHYELKNYQNAILDFKRCTELRDNAQDWLNLAGNKRFNGDMKGAYWDYTKAIELEPTNHHLWFNRGHIKRYAGDMVGARQDFEEAVRLGDSSSQEWVSKCSLIDNSRSIEEIIDEVKLNVMELIDAGSQERAVGNFPQALGYYMRAVELYPELPEPKLWLDMYNHDLGY